MQSTPATLIRLTRLTDTSLIVHWFTETHGLVKTVAKGARRPKSQFGGQLDLFFGGEIAFQSARRGDLHALREVSISRWREGLRTNYTGGRVGPPARRLPPSTGSGPFAAGCARLAARRPRGLA